MNATLINSFPPVHSYDSPRSWFLAAIIVLHVGFFWALSNGLIVETFPKKVTKTEVVTLEREPEAQPRPLRNLQVKARTDITVYVPTPPKGVIYETVKDDSTGLTDGGSDVGPVSESGSGPALPVIVEPRIDSRYFSEPVYPAADIRAEHEGTVVLSIEVLENGRVGSVRIERSSGYKSLDQSAARETRRWRFMPGTQDGRRLTMWRKIPVTFELKDKTR